VPSTHQPSTPLWLTLAIGTIIPLLTAVIGWQAGNNSINKDYVQIAAQIAQNENSPAPLKQWAVKLLNEMSPVPFSQEVANSLAVYPAKNPLFESFILLPKDFLNNNFAKPCDNVGYILRKKQISDDDFLKIFQAQEECRLKMDGMIQIISEMKNESDKTASEEKIKEVQNKKLAEDPFAEKK
jgi:hypothetical protein